VQGGPSPAEVERVITTRKKNMALAKTNITKLKQNLANAESKLDSIAESYSLSNSSTIVRLKKSNL
jgi:hypothetical protein